MTALRLSALGFGVLTAAAAYLWWNHPPNHEAARRRRSWADRHPPTLYLNDNAR